MKLTKTIFLKICLWGFLFFFSTHLTASSQKLESTALQRLTEKFEQGEVLRSSFHHQIVDSFTGDTTSQQGELWLTASAYKIKTSTTVLLIDGRLSRVYDKVKERVIISKYNPEEDDFAPSQLLTDLESKYTRVEQDKKGGIITVTLSTNDIFSTFRKVIIKLDKNTIPLKIAAVDQADNEMVTTFSEARFVPKTADMFELDYPETTKIVDLRQ